MSAAPQTPLLDKLRKIEPERDAVQEFLDWMQGQGYVIARYLKPEEQDAYGYWGQMPVPVNKNFEQLIGDHFGIDPKALSAERDAVLRHYQAQLQAAQTKETTAA